MACYFFEVAYKGTAYAGFQIQENAVTIQSLLENALNLVHGWSGVNQQGQKFKLTGSSRTDAGVHALQNFFHADYDGPVHPQTGYKVNAILPQDVVLKKIITMPASAHCRFDASSRAYRYCLHQAKDPFVAELSYYYPFTIDIKLLQACADAVARTTDFSAFAKANSNTQTTQCVILDSRWEVSGSKLAYHVKGNRFLRGMVRLLTATQLKVARQKISLLQFQHMLKGDGKAVHAAPAKGLTLMAVNYPTGYFEQGKIVFASF